MGNVNFGAPREVIDKVRSMYGVQVFVETGTFRGSTAAWASEHFERVFTIEGSAELHHQAKAAHADKRNIEFLHGDSRTVLREVVSQLRDTSALFWLDAHWMPGSFGEVHECPILEELATINQSSADHFVFIDDARLFLAPPPLPHRAADWPDVAAVLFALDRPDRPTNYTVVRDDVIISLPASTRESMQDFFQDLTTAASSQETTSAVSPLRHQWRRLKDLLRQTANFNRKGHD